MSGPVCRSCRSILIPLAVWLATCLAPPVAAAAAETGFYAGKSIALLVRFSPGGGSRARHIPGNPKLIAQNMLGAGSLKAVNSLYNVEVSAPPTGGRKALE